MAIDQEYASQIRKEIGIFAVWLPNALVEIGQYGQLRGALFQPERQLKGLYAKPNPAKATYDFTIHADRAINTEAKALAEAGVTSGNALLEVRFQKEAAVTFSAPECEIKRVDDLRALGERLIAMKKAGDFRNDDCIVVEVITAPKVTIIASLKSGAEVKFEVAAKTPISAQVMANLDEASSLKISKGVGAKVIGEGPLTPLFRLAFLKSHILSDPTIGFRGPREPVEGKRVQVTDSEYLEIY